ncbi:hypothetical protein [Micromonospora sp. LH3U1]|uniref:hypothetical protein n=1 Tax=Micromonospora sp. LH3U1 TaxID=3018339 RepID=UPI0023495A80|nr:hypothetical protein [Micromonospora sp. LH3U1]WCN79892.1 hypothetical protein PCA76_23360 [Micromonospora sp. LH3U1]
MSRRMGVVLGVLAVLVTACGSSACPDCEEPRPVRPAWQSVDLPITPGAPGRPVLRDATACAGRWYVVGGVVDLAGETRPAAWSSPDAISWVPLPTAPVTFYGQQHVLSAAACRDGRLAAVGAKNGGAHGNPRTGTWRQAPDGTLHEVDAPFERYAGPRAVNVARLAAGPQGWLIAGSRIDGAAVWISPDAAGFALVEGAPELAGDERGRTAAYDAVAVPSGWLVVGALLPPGGTALVPLAWSSADGRSWRRAALPVVDGRGQAQRVAVLGDVPVAVGSVRAGFGSWRLTTQGWRPAGGFGAAGTGVASAAGLVAVGQGLVAVTRDGDRHGLWLSVDVGESWRAMTMPQPVPDSGDTAVAVTSTGDRLLLVADDGKTSRAWWAGVSDLDR